MGRAHPKHAVHACRVASACELAQQPQHGSVKHLELACAAPTAKDTAARLTYAMADDLAVYPDNGAALAASVATRLGLELEQVFELRGGTAPPLPTPCSVAQALRYHADLRAPASKELLLLLAASCADAAQAEALARLTRPEGKQVTRARTRTRTLSLSLSLTRTLTRPTTSVSCATAAGSPSCSPRAPGQG